jgi:ABC-type multidrug transport system fused ATPase/permease subunit
MELVVAKVAEFGHVLQLRTPTGEVLSVSSGRLGRLRRGARGDERTIAALGPFILLVVLMISTSPNLGLIVLVASPLLVGSSFFLLRPLHHAQEVERKRSSELTGRVTDIVAGLRILRGIGGEDTFGANWTWTASTQPSGGRGRRSGRASPPVRATANAL